MCAQMIGADVLVQSVTHRLGLEGQAWGLHLTVDLGGERFVADRAIGNRHLEPSRHVELGCLAKPIVATGSVVVAEHLGLDLGVPICSFGDRWSHLDDQVTLGSLCCHAARIREPSYFAWLALPDQRPSVADIKQDPPGSHSFSEVGAGLVLRDVLEHLSGRSFGDELRERFLVPLGLEGRVVIDGEEAAALNREDLNVLWDDLGGRPLPMMHVFSETYRANQDPAFGGWATPEGFHDFLLACARDASNEEGLLSFVGRSMIPYESDPVRRQPVEDVILKRPAGFWCGFMTGDTPGEIPVEDSGHVLMAIVGIVQGFGLIDLRRDLVVSAFGDRMSSRPIEGAEFRYAVLNAVYQQLEA